VSEDLFSARKTYLLLGRLIFC